MNAVNDTGPGQRSPASFAGRGAGVDSTKQDSLRFHSRSIKNRIFQAHALVCVWRTADRRFCGVFFAMGGVL
jgi:hypothetical protein